MKPQLNEHTIVGGWESKGDEVVPNRATQRIEWLTAQHFEQIAFSPEAGAWETLFRDPEDGRYWERTYPESEMHGGGPPKLAVVTKEYAARKYGKVTPSLRSQLLQ